MAKQHKQLQAALLLAVVALLLAFWGGRLAHAENSGIFTVVMENDVLHNADRHFTHGSRFSYYSEKSRDDWVSRTAELMPWFSLDTDQELWRSSIAIGQNIYTPSDISVSHLQTDERPYAGYLYLGLGAVRVVSGEEPGTGMVGSFELQLGVVGPWARARDVQTWWHSEVISADRPEGWDHQLRNEFTVNLYWDRQWRYSLAESGRAGVDLVPHAGLALGTVATHLAGGLTWRLGKGLGNDNGPPRIRPSLPGAGYFVKTSKVQGYFFAGGEIRLVGRNIFLDGNTFRSSHRVSRKTVVFDLQYGLVISYRKVKFALTNIARGREFEGQQSPDFFTAFSFSYQH